MLESLLNKVADLLVRTFTRISFFYKVPSDACNFITKETLAQVFFCEFCEIFKNNFLHKTLLNLLKLCVLLFYFISFMRSWAKCFIDDFEQVAGQQVTLWQACFISFRKSTVTSGIILIKSNMYYFCAHRELFHRVGIRTHNS